MLTKKLIAVAAAVALAVSHVAAVDQAAHVKVSLNGHKVQPHHHKQDSPQQQQSPVQQQTPQQQETPSVTPAPTPAPEAEAEEDDGSEDSDSEESEAPEEEDDGSEDSDSEESTPEGDADVEVDIILEGNATTTTTSNTTTTTTVEQISLCLPGWSKVSVEGTQDIYCVQGQMCVDQIKDGACPGPQQGIPYGSYCDLIKTGVYGCKPVTEDMTKKEDSPYTPVCTGEGESPMSVEGVEGVFCVTGQACVADIKDGACPDAQEGLEFGAYCGKVKTGVYGCKPYTEDAADDEEGTEEGDEEDDSEDTVTIDICTGEGESPMSVEGVEGVFCVTGQACVADIKDGACPGPQEGLELGAHCGVVKTGVYGCKPNTEDTTQEEETTDESEEDDDVCTGEGESPMSVEGVEGIFCVTGQACVADIKDGACPDEQEGLEFGAYCGVVKTGVYGCKPLTKEMYEKEEVPVEETTAPTPAPTPAPTAAPTAAPTPAPAPAPAPATPDCKGPGQSPMSVEGVQGVFCVTGQACVADIDGACPEKQEGLPFGAYCGTVASGVKGCKPNTSKKMMKKHAKHHVKIVHHKAAAVCSGAGQSPMSVEGVEGVFCVSGQSCVADIKNGACPGQQSGLPWGAYCDKVKTGVYGCKPMTEEMYRKQHPESAPAASCNGPNQSPMSVEGVEGVFCVTGQACVANIDGACPAKQSGLPYGSYCGTVVTGVKGCKPNLSKKMMKKNASKHKGHVFKVAKVHAAKIVEPKKPVVKKTVVKKITVKKTATKKHAHHKKH